MGTAGSALGGAAAGAVAGTALGVPVVGTVIGALSGAAIGAARRRTRKTTPKAKSAAAPAKKKSSTTRRSTKTKTKPATVRKATKKTAAKSRGGKPKQPRLHAGAQLRADDGRRAAHGSSHVLDHVGLANPASFTASCMCQIVNFRKRVSRDEIRHAFPPKLTLWIAPRARVLDLLRRTLERTNLTRRSDGEAAKPKPALGSPLGVWRWCIISTRKTALSLGGGNFKVISSFQKPIGGVTPILR
jgi:hypothetical protein